MIRRFFVFAIGLLFCGAAALGQNELVGLYLTWQGDPSTTITVNWVNLYEDAPTTVWYRAEGGEQWESESGTSGTMEPSVLQVRRVELTGLEPDTIYEFIIQEQLPEKVRGMERFRTMPEALDRPVRFVTGGDMMHTRAWVDAMNRRAGALDPDFALLGGDLAYANNVDAARWIDWLESWRLHARGKDGRLIPTVVAIGNHEVEGGYGQSREAASHFYSLFKLPDNRSYYALDFGEYLSLVVLDSDHTEPIAGAQAAWLEEALRARSDQEFPSGRAKIEAMDAEGEVFDQVRLDRARTRPED